MPMIELTVPAGVLTDAGRVEVQRELAAVLSETDALRMWVLVHEQAEGTWSAGGRIVRYADLVKLAKGTVDA